MSLVIHCHGGSPFTNFVCVECGGYLHIHLHQVYRIPPDVQIVSRCTQCGCLLALPDKAVILAMIREFVETGDPGKFPEVGFSER